MTSPENQRLAELVEALDHLVLREGAQVIVDQLPGLKTKSGAFVGNQSGYLRLGIEFLKAGLAEPKQPESGLWQVPMEWKYLVSQKSYVVGFDEFLRDDALELGPTFADPVKFSNKEMSRLSFPCLLLVAAIGFALIGLVSVCWWIASFFSW